MYGQGGVSGTPTAYISRSSFPYSSSFPNPWVASLTAWGSFNPALRAKTGSVPPPSTGTRLPPPPAFVRF